MVHLNPAAIPVSKTGLALFPQVKGLPHLSFSSLARYAPGCALLRRRTAPPDGYNISCRLLVCYRDALPLPSPRQRSSALLLLVISVVHIHAMPGRPKLFPTR